LFAHALDWVQFAFWITQFLGLIGLHLNAVRVMRTQRDLRIFIMVQLSIKTA